MNDFLYISCIYYYSSTFNVPVIPSVKYSETWPKIASTFHVHIQYMILMS